MGRLMYAGHLAIAAATDAKILAARATFDRLAVSAPDLARAAGVSPPTALASWRRLAARGEWPYPPLVATAKTLGKAWSPGPVRRAASAKFRAPVPSGKPCYLLVDDTWNRPPRDLGDVKAASAEALAMWRAAVKAGRRAKAC